MKMRDARQRATSVLLVFAVVILGQISSASNARANYVGDASAIIAGVTTDPATYDAALPQLEALVAQSTTRSDRNNIVRGMYTYIPPTSQGGTNENRRKLARIIENQILAKDVDKMKYHGDLTDDIWISPDTSGVLKYQMRPIDSNMFYAQLDDLQLLSVPEGSPNYLMSDEDLGLGRCKWSIADNCVPTIPGSVQTLQEHASTQPASVQVGQTLTPQPTFSVTPWRVWYVWQRDTDQASTVLQASTNPSYTVQAADKGATLSCIVYASKAGYALNPYFGAEQGSWTGIPVEGGVTPPPPPVDKTFSKVYTPKASGTAQVSRTLKVSLKGSKPKASFAYQWNRDGAPIVGATRSKYTEMADDLGRVLTVTVTGTRSGYTPTVRTSAPTKVVAPGTITRGRIKASGTSSVNRTLKASTSRWTSGVSFSYQWQEWVKDPILRKWSWTPIVGATGASYTLTPTDLKHRTRVVVTATKPGYADAKPKASARTKPTSLGTLGAPKPTVTGTLTAGETVTVVTGAWNPPGTTFTYQWYKNGKKIKGATAATYMIAPGDVGKSIKVKVTGSAYAYRTKSVSSSSVKIPVPLVTPPTTSTPPKSTPTVTPTPSASPSPIPSPTGTR